MQAPFPAVYSTLCPAALAGLIENKYAFKNVHCQLLVRGVGDSYLVRSTDERYVIRIYRTTHRTLAQIEEEVALLLELYAAGVSVSHPILDVEGQAIQKIYAAEGERYAVLFSYAAGQVVRNMNQFQLQLLGKEMALFHNISSGKGKDTARWAFDMQHTLHRPLRLLKSIFKEDPEGYAWLQSAAERVEKKINSLEHPLFSSGFCHFDFLPKNFHFDADNITLFDFDFMGYGWLVNDIMSFWQHLTLEVFAGRMQQAVANDAFQYFLDAYQQHRSVSKQELEAIPYLSLGFWLFYMGFHTTHDQFYMFSNPAQVKLYLGFLQHIATTYWD